MTTLEAKCSLLDSRNQDTKRGTYLVLRNTDAAVLFVVFILVFVIMLLGLSFILVPLAQITHSISMLLYAYVPYKLAKFYTEYEPHGKKMHIFLADYFCYLYEFRWNKKAIYHDERVEPYDDEDIVFEQTHL